MGTMATGDSTDSPHLALPGSSDPMKTAAVLSTSVLISRSLVTRAGMAGVNPDLIHRTFERLRRSKDELLILDGGTGEELFVQGVLDDRKIWSATAVVRPEYHETLKKVHQSFIDSGSEAITVNSYGIVPGVGFSLPEIKRHVATAGQIARSAAENDNGQTTALVLGSMGPLVESYRPDLILPHTEGTVIYKVIADALSPYVDCVLAETMSSYEECTQAVEAVGALCDQNARPLMVSFTLDTKGRLRSGELVNEGLRRLFDFAALHGVNLLGVMLNCAEPEAISRGLQTLVSDSTVVKLMAERGIVLGAYANRLTPVPEDWTLKESDTAQPMRDDLSPERYSNDFVLDWTRTFGVQMIGGCCGITPEHIAVLRQELRRAHTK